MLVVAPLFDKRRFSGERYHRGGITDGKVVVPAAQWTGNTVLRIVDWVHKAEGANEITGSLATRPEASS
jgi:hypothetical protein